jgi:hypothetical protein
MAHQNFWKIFEQNKRCSFALLEHPGHAITIWECQMGRHPLGRKAMSNAERQRTQF